MQANMLYILYQWNYIVEKSADWMNHVYGSKVYANYIGYCITWFFFFKWMVFFVGVNELVLY